MRYNRVTEIHTDPCRLPEADRRPQKKKKKKCLKAGTMTLISYEPQSSLFFDPGGYCWSTLPRTIRKQVDKYYFVSTL